MLVYYFLYRISPLRNYRDHPRMIDSQQIELFKSSGEIVVRSQYISDNLNIAMLVFSNIYSHLLLHLFI